MVDQTISLPFSIPASAASDPEACARAVSLIYVNDSQPGIQRVRKGSAFVYLYKGRTLRARAELERIRKIVIPPAWEQVWICKAENGHIQATGFDTRMRKQYKYHPLWSRMRNDTKFSRMLGFGKKLPALRKQIEKDLKEKKLTQRKVLAAVVSLMEHTYIRIGNSGYEKLYRSYGLTTLKDHHVRIEGDRMRFSFTGKKGIRQEVNLRNPRLARIVRQCREIPGRELFQYYDEQGEAHVIDSGDVNAYIGEATGEEYTAKDFRTWAGSVHALYALKDLGHPETLAARRRNLINAMDYVSSRLGNTRTVCRKYYVHPVIALLYERGQLQPYTDAFDGSARKGLTAGEKVFMKLLRQC